MTAAQPRHRSPAAPAPFAARWRELAACRGAYLNLFFPGRGESAEPARRVCSGCAVREPCLDYALSHGITYGIWGGLAERERRALRSCRVGDERRERDAAIPAAAAAGYSHTAIGRAFGLTRTSVSRVLSGGADDGSGHDHLEFHDRWLPGTMRRITSITRECRTQCVTLRSPSDWPARPSYR